MSMKLLGSDVASSPLAVLPDTEIVRKIRDGETALFEVLMRRHNQRVYRAVRAVMNEEADVEDVMQQAYINAFTHLDQFERRAQFSTWLIRIALNEAFAKRRKIKGPECDRHDCPRCHGAWIRMVVHDRTQVVLRCMRCGGWFSVPPAPQVRSSWLRTSLTSSNLADVALSAGSAS